MTGCDQRAEQHHDEHREHEFIYYRPNKDFPAPSPLSRSTGCSLDSESERERVRNTPPTQQRGDAERHRGRRRG